VAPPQGSLIGREMSLWGSVGSSKYSLSTMPSLARVRIGLKDDGAPPFSSANGGSTFQLACARAEENRDPHRR